MTSSVIFYFRSSTLPPTLHFFARSRTPPSTPHLPKYTMLACIFAPEPKSVTTEEVEACQKAWADAIVNISKIYRDKGKFVEAAGEAAGALYGYGHGNVLFKPTKAAENPFRPDASEAMSYFVGENNVEKGYTEDAGFAINGGKGWDKVIFENHQIDCHGSVALAMGTYFFTCATSKDVVRVEYTFGYKRNDDGNVRICLHHSSVPYSA